MCWCVTKKNPKYFKPTFVVFTFFRVFVPKPRREEVQHSAPPEGKKFFFSSAEVAKGFLQTFLVFRWGLAVTPPAYQKNFLRLRERIIRLLDWSVVSVLERGPKEVFYETPPEARNFFFGAWDRPLAVFGFFSDSWDAFQVRSGGVNVEFAEFSHVLPRHLKFTEFSHVSHRGGFDTIKFTKSTEFAGVLSSSVSSQSRAFWPFMVWIEPFVHRVCKSHRVRRFNEDYLVAEFSEDPQKRARSVANGVREFP